MILITKLMVIELRVIDDNGRDKNSHIFKHSAERKYRPLAFQSVVSWEEIVVKTNFAEK